MLIWCSLTSRTVLKMAEGRLATMPAKMIREIPFPIPFSLIRSPSHMRKAVPAVSVITAMRRNPQPCTSTGTMGVPPGAFILSRPKAMPMPWMMLRTMVPYLVYWVIFLRPASPSLDRRSRAGMTTVRSCRMMEALM